MGNNVNRQRIIIAIGVGVLSVQAWADKGGAAFKRGAKAEHEASYDTAQSYYKEAATLSPANARYRAAYTRMRFAAGSQHLRTGQVLRNAGALTEALVEFQHAVEIDSSSFIAQQELRRTSDMVSRKERKRTNPKAESPLAKMVEEVGAPLELQPVSNSTISLRMTAPAVVAYRTICKLAGINVLTDADYRPQKISVELSDVTLQEALDMVRLQSKTFFRVVTPNTIFVAADSPGKRKELEQNVVKTFYLKNISTPNELQEAANLVRQILDVSRVQLLAAQDALILRGTRDQMILAEKLLTDFDKPKAEVIIDVAVMEVTRDRLRTIGANLPTSVSFGVTQGDPISAATGTGGTPAPANSGGYKVHVGQFSAVLPSSGSFTLLASDSNAKVLQSPQLRALNDEKATLRIGDRVPIATGSFQPGMVGGAGVSPLISTQFQYLDVGVNIDIIPHIHADGEVTLRMALEISSVTGVQNIGGISQPVIGQRRIEHTARLADGEVNLLGGILEESETQSLSGYPWISKLPILKYLFAQENKDRRENEIIFAITPHIVRSKEVNDQNLRVVEVGTGNSIELRHPRPAPAPDGSKVAQDAGGAKPDGNIPQNGTNPAAAVALTGTANASRLTLPNKQVKPDDPR